MRIKLLISFSLLLGIQQLKAIHPLRQAIVNASNWQDAKNIYSTYTSTQKEIVWKDKIEEVFQSKNWSNQQLKVINELLLNLNADIFIDGSPQDIKFKKFLSSWRGEAIASLGLANYNNAFITIHPFNAPKAEYISGSGGNGGTDCTCNIGATFTCDWLLQSNECNQIECKLVDIGCGELWRLSCDGLCTAIAGTSTVGSVLKIW